MIPHFPMLTDRELGLIHSNPLFHSLAESQYLTCRKCDYRWFPRTCEMPKACPECKSRLHGMPREITEIVPEERYALFPGWIKWSEDYCNDISDKCIHIDAAIHAFVLLEYVRSGIPGPRPPPPPAPPARTYPPVQSFGPARSPGTGGYRRIGNMG